VDVDNDGDGDNYSAWPPGGCNFDCNDGNLDIYPGAPEICDTYDNDCDGATVDGEDELWYHTACDATVATDLDACEDDWYECDPGGAQVCVDLDNDGDGDNYSVGAIACSGDCADGDPARHPGATEFCDGDDDDCDGQSDDSDADAHLWCESGGGIGAMCTGTVCNCSGGPDCLLGECCDGALVCTTVGCDT
jgi:hypothetical protein